jgi:F-type H+-transporting ATPase subunit gamma
MPSLIDLRRRIRAVKNTQQITKAMKMVAASKLRRAQERIMNARPYTTLIQDVLASVAARVDPSMHPLLAVREPRPESKTLVIVITGDKGLCGSFNTNVIKAAGAFLVELTGPSSLGLVGRKGRDFFVRRGFSVLFEQIMIFQKLRFEHAQEVAKLATDAFLSGDADRVVLIYNEFKSVMSQRVVIHQMLPIERAEIEQPLSQESPRGASPGEGYLPVEYLYEPSAQVIFDKLLPRYVEAQVARAMLESNAAFFAAQMTAMDTATKNSGEMIANLTLYMNKVRQAAITREIIEVVSGAEAL